MCKLCENGQSQNYGGSRRNFLKNVAGAGVAALAFGSLNSSSYAAGAMDTTNSILPRNTGQAGKRYLIRGGAVLSMDGGVGDFAKADVLVEGKKILAVRPNTKQHTRKE